MEDYTKVGHIVSQADEDGNYYYKDVMGGSFKKFLLLMWKNWKLQYRKPVQTIIEIIVPVVFTILLVVTRKLVDPELQAEKIYDPFCPIPQFTQPINNVFNISLCPNNAVIPDADKSGFLSMGMLAKMAAKIQDKSMNYSEIIPGIVTIIKKFASMFKASVPLQIIYSPNTTDHINRIMAYFIIPFGSLTAPMGFEDSTSMENYYLTSPSDSVLAAIQFDDKYKNMSTIENEKDLKVYIRFPSELKVQSTSLVKTWQTNLVFPLFQYPGPRLRECTSGAEPNYYKEGFLAIQHMLGFAITLAKNNVSFNQVGNWLLDNQFPKVLMRRFAFAEFYSDELLQALMVMFPLIIMMSFVYTAINTVKAITTEKEKQLKESMKIMGLPNWLHWTAWFIKCLIFLLVSIIIMVILLKVKWYPNSDHSVLTYADSSLLLFFLLVYICCSITFCFAISVFFSKANNASTISGLIWFFTYMPYVFIQQSYDELSLLAKLFISLTHNSAMALGFKIILMYEGTGEGMQWENLFEPITPDDNLSLGLVIIMLILDTLIYLLIALYVEAVFPGEYGVPKPWNYLFTKSYWCGVDGRYGNNKEVVTPQPQNEEFFEPDPKYLNVGIKIVNLRKEFGDKAAVNNLNINMYQDQITVLLGHNGAGKTTTMSMLTGMITPTAGTASINGYDIRRNIEGVRRSLGLCPQHNIIFDELTVAEHFYFYSKLKGLPAAEIDEEVDKYVALLAFESKRDSKSSTLSGGMKRKLCVGIALCGGSKVVMLDEPTSGMDPSARRVLWSLIQSQKEGRTILLSTHFMDEADLLGDRIAIMAEGELQCCGSSFFLKKKYGTGYCLTMDKEKDCDVVKTTQLLKKYIPDIEINGNVGSELSYLLEENRSAVFEAMLKELENNSDRLGIRSYGISLTTMEEVFMKVGADHEKQATNQSLHTDKSSIGKCSLAPTHTGGLDLIANQFCAMLIKKYLSIIRSWFLFACQLVIPALLLVVAVMMSRTRQKLGPLKAREMSLNQFSSPITLVQAADDSTTTYKDAYEEILKDNNFARQEQSNLTDTMLSLTKTVPSTVRRNYIVGASFEYSNESNSPLFTAYFNNDPYHSPGVALGLVMNAIYKIQTKCSDCSINFVNYPLPYTAESQVQQVSALPNMGFNLSFNICFSMAFVSGFYVLFVVRENVSKSKHLQFVSGMKAWIFWTTSFLVDMSTYFATVILYIIVLLILNEDGFTTAEDIGRIFVIMTYFAWAFLPLVYLLGYLFQIPSTGFSRVMLTAIFSGNATFIAVQIFQQFKDLKDVGKTLHWIFLLSPYYALSTGFSESYKAYSYNSFCKKYTIICDALPSPQTCMDRMPASVKEICDVADGNYYKWSSPGIGRNMLYLFVEGIVFFLIIFIIEYEVFSRLIYFITQKLSPKHPVDVPNEDPDVRDEREKIRNNHEADLHNNYILALKDLTKYYKDFLAVNGLCLGVKKFECFGLLGINGAGKTTTFKMMTGDEKISYGEGWVNGHSMKTALKEVQKAIGYCPQFDALLDDMTGRETIIMYALIRGISFENSKKIPEYLAREFDFSKHLDKRVKQMSGGNKRKLSTSLSLIGDPPLLYLDEPTTGMDPATKRYLWDVLCRIRDSGKSIVLTSHSMEECEALCTRLAIMVNGNFKCLGSTQHLKSKFAEGYSLTIKIRKRPDSSGNEHSETGHIEEFIGRQLPRAELKERHEELLSYQIRDKSIPWSRMFGILEEGKRRNEDIEDYSLGQSTLEQVFLTFTGGISD